MSLNPRIPNQDELEALKLSIKLDHREDKNIPSEDLLEIVRVVFKNNCFEFDSVIKQQLSGTAIGNKCASPYACIFMDRLETVY